MFGSDTTSSGLPKDLLIPSINFSLVMPGVYRSGYPAPRNHAFIKALGIRSVVYLCPEVYDSKNLEFLKSAGITVHHVPMDGNKEPFVVIPDEDLQNALSLLIDTRNHPVMVHCNKGKHRTGTLIGCLRKLLGWSLCSIFEEYRTFAGTKGRLMDEQCMELFVPCVRANLAYIPSWMNSQVCFPPSQTENSSAQDVPIAASTGNEDLQSRFLPSTH